MSNWNVFQLSTLESFLSTLCSIKLHLFSYKCQNSTNLRRKWIFKNKTTSSSDVWYNLIDLSGFFHSIQSLYFSQQESPPLFNFNCFVRLNLKQTSNKKIFENAQLRFKDRNYFVFFLKTPFYHKSTKKNIWKNVMKSNW